MYLFYQCLALLLIAFTYALGRPAFLARLAHFLVLLEAFLYLFNAPRIVEHDLHGRTVVESSASASNSLPALLILKYLSFHYLHLFSQKAFFVFAFYLSAAYPAGSKKESLTAVKGMTVGLGIIMRRSLQSFFFFMASR